MGSDLPSGRYILRCRATQTVLELKDSKIDEGTPAVCNILTGGLEQTWDFKQLDDISYSVTSGLDDKTYLGFENPVTSEAVVARKSPTIWDLRFVYENTFVITYGGLCLDLGGSNSNPGSPTILWGRHDYHNQEWEFTPVEEKIIPPPVLPFVPKGRYVIRNVKDRFLVLDLSSSGALVSSCYSPEGSPTQIWKIERDDTGLFNISNDTEHKDGTHLSYVKAGADQPVTVGKSSKLWTLTSVNDSLNIFTISTGKLYLDVGEATLQKEAPPLLKSPLDSANQYWTIEDLTPFIRDRQYSPILLDSITSEHQFDVVTVADSAPYNIIRSFTAKPSTKWTFSRNQDGSYFIWIAGGNSVHVQDVEGETLKAASITAIRAIPHGSRHDEYYLVTNSGLVVESEPRNGGAEFSLFKLSKEFKDSRLQLWNFAFRG